MIKLFTFNNLCGSIIYVTGYRLCWHGYRKKEGRVMNIKEIARRAGVSSATISRVLNNSRIREGGDQAKVT